MNAITIENVVTCNDGSHTGNEFVSFDGTLRKIRTLGVGAGAGQQAMHNVALVVIRAARAGVVKPVNAEQIWSEFTTGAKDGATRLGATPKATKNNPDPEADAECIIDGADTPDTSRAEKNAAVQVSKLRTLIKFGMSGGARNVVGTALRTMDLWSAAASMGKRQGTYASLVSVARAGLKSSTELTDEQIMACIIPPVAEKDTSEAKMLGDVLKAMEKIHAGKEENEETGAKASTAYPSRQLEQAIRLIAARIAESEAEQANAKASAMAMKAAA